MADFEAKQLQGILGYPPGPARTCLQEIQSLSVSVTVSLSFKINRLGFYLLFHGIFTNPY